MGKWNFLKPVTYCTSGAKAPLQQSSSWLLGGPHRVLLQEAPQQGRLRCFQKRNEKGIAFVSMHFLFASQDSFLIFLTSNNPFGLYVPLTAIAKCLAGTVCPETLFWSKGRECWHLRGSWCFSKAVKKLSTCKYLYVFIHIFEYMHTLTQFNIFR